jgi:hypothetical protein
VTICEVHSHVFPHPFGPPPKTGKLGNRARWDRIGPEYKYQANSHDSGRKSPTEPQIHETKNGKNTHEPKKRTVATATITHSKCTEQHTTRSTPDLTKRKTDTHNTVSTRHKKDPNPSRNANTRTRTKKTTNALPKRLAKTLKKVGALVLVLLMNRIVRSGLKEQGNMEKELNAQACLNWPERISQKERELTPTRTTISRKNQERDLCMNKAKYSFEYSVANKDCETNADVYNLQNTGNKRVLGHHVHHPIARKFHQKRKIGEMLSKFLQPHRSTFTQHTPRKISTPNIARIADPSNKHNEQSRTPTSRLEIRHSTEQSVPKHPLTHVRIAIGNTLKSIEKMILKVTGANTTHSNNTNCDIPGNTKERIIHLMAQGTQIAREIAELIARATTCTIILGTQSMIHEEMEWIHGTRRNSTRATEWDRLRKGGRITWESPPRKIRRMCKLKKVHQTKHKGKKYPNYAATKRVRTTKNTLKRWIALIRGTPTHLQRTRWKWREQWTVTCALLLCKTETTIREILKDAHHETQRILTNTIRHFQDAGYGILSILVATTAMIGNLDINGNAYQQNERSRTKKDEIDTREQWETDLEEHRPHLTRTIEEIGESWGPHKPITKRRTTRKKWYNHAATKRTITTIGELVKMKESEKGLRTQAKSPGTRGHLTDGKPRRCME